jgi:hypothetical protein
MIIFRDAIYFQKIGTLIMVLPYLESSLKQALTNAKPGLRFSERYVSILGVE